MPLFPCSKCGCVEDTALCHYWSARLRQTPPVCSACDPTIVKWHGEFPQESARNWTNDERGFLLWSRSDLERWLGQPIEIIGKASPSRPPSGSMPTLCTRDRVSIEPQSIAFASGPAPTLGHQASGPDH